MYLPGVLRGCVLGKGFYGADKESPRRWVAAQVVTRLLAAESDVQVASPRVQTSISHSQQLQRAEYLGRICVCTTLNHGS